MTSRIDEIRSRLEAFDSDSHQRPSHDPAWLNDGPVVDLYASSPADIRYLLGEVGRLQEEIAGHEVTIKHLVESKDMKAEMQAVVLALNAPRAP